MTHNFISHSHGLMRRGGCYTCLHFSSYTSLHLLTLPCLIFPSTADRHIAIETAVPRSYQGSCSVSLRVLWRPGWFHRTTAASGTRNRTNEAIYLIRSTVPTDLGATASPRLSVNTRDPPYWSLGASVPDHLATVKHWRLSSPCTLHRSGSSLQRIPTIKNKECF